MQEIELSRVSSNSFDNASHVSGVHYHRKLTYDVAKQHLRLAPNDVVPIGSRRSLRRPKSSQYTFRVKKHTGEILCVSVYKTDTLTTLFEKVHNTIYGVQNYNIYNQDDYDVIPMKLKPQYAQQIIDIFSFQNNTILSIPCNATITVDEYMKHNSEFFPKSTNSIFTQYDVFVIDSEYIGMIQNNTQQNSSILQKIKNTIVNILIF